MAGGRTGLETLEERGEDAARRVRGGSGFPTACQRGPFLHPWKNTAQGLALHRRKEGLLFLTRSHTRTHKKNYFRWPRSDMSIVCRRRRRLPLLGTPRFGPGLFFPLFRPPPPRPSRFQSPFSFATLGCFPPLSIFGAPLRRRPPLLRCCCCR